MKKTLAAALIASLFLLLVGCGARDVSSDDPGNAVSAPPVSADENNDPALSSPPDPIEETEVPDAPEQDITDAAEETTPPPAEETDPPSPEPQQTQPPADELPEPSSPATTDPPAVAETDRPAPPVSETPEPPAPESPAPAASDPPPSPASAPEETAQPAPENDDTPSPAPVGELAFNGIDESSSAVLPATEDMGQDYIDRIIFLGDSTTYGMKYYRMLTDGRDTKQVWTPTSGTLTLSYQSFADIWYPDDGTEIPIRDAVQKKQPEYMIITLGVNGVSFMDEDYFKSEYTDLVTGIQQASPDTKIILQSIFPVASNYEYQGSINNEKINQANQWVLEVAESTGVRYLNTCTVLIGSDGYMVSSYQNGDGLHLNETGFGLVLDYIRTHAYP